MGEKANLTSTKNLVESPFILATIGGVTFGSYSAQHAYGSAVKVTYPNYMTSLSVQKINGTVNTYTLNFTYQVRAGEDPNRLDKIFSKATKDRQISLQYGDWNSPKHIYKEESAIITNIKYNLNMSNSSINYTLTCTSDAVGLSSTSYNFPARFAKPSDVLKEMLSNARYGMKDVFTGMRNQQQVLAKNLIASNDKKVRLEQKNLTPLAYMNYLVESMVSTTNSDSGIKKDGTYFLTIHDDASSSGGVYFKVTEVKNNTKSFVATDTFVLDVNYPSDHFVTDFNVVNDQSWAILYECGEDVSQESFTYSITDDGLLASEYSPSLVRSKTTASKSQQKSNWWSRMTQFPIQAEITIKGLIRPSILMSYVYLNVWFAGAQKHISSGLYIITKQVDALSASGYRTTLSLMRVGGDEG